MQLGLPECRCCDALSAVRLTLFGHSHFEALLEAAVLTAVPRHLVDDAVLVAVTRVDHVLLDASAEEPLWTQTERKFRHQIQEGRG